MPRRLGGLIAAAIVQLVALVLAHDLVFLARYGSRYNEELVHAGHGGAWAAAVESSIVLGALLAAAGVLRLVQLRIRLRTRGGSAPVRSTAGSLPVRALLAGWRRAAVWIAPATVALLTIQENLERLAIGRPMPGVTILLTPEYAGGLWIALLVGVAVAFVVALFQWRRAELLARIEASRPRPRRAATTVVPRTGIDIDTPADSLLGRRSALRAPPVALAL
jgi:hypothetical protein